MSTIKTSSQIKNTLRLALLATTLSTGMLTMASAQTTPAVPAPTATPMPPVAPMAAAETFFIGKLQPSAWLASDAMDEPVLNMQKEKIGEVNDLIVDGDGKVVAAVVGIGGFLGMGEKDVAITFRAIRMSRNENGKAMLVVDVTKDALKAAPAYKPTTSAQR